LVLILLIVNSVRKRGEGNKSRRMVKLGSKKKKDIERQLKAPREDQDEDLFLESNVYLQNEALNDEEEQFNERDYQEKNDQMIQKLREIDGKKRKNLRTEIVQGELDVNISNTFL